MQEKWTENDLFLFQHLISDDNDLEYAVQQSHDRQFPEHEVSKTQGMLLSLLIRMSKSKRVLELGTLAGYSTIWMAKAIPDGGQVVTLEYEQERFELASQNIRHAGLQDKVQLLCGPAAVSYTHLDVYKRQMLTGSCSWIRSRKNCRTRISSRCVCQVRRKPGTSSISGGWR